MKRKNRRMNMKEWQKDYLLYGIIPSFEENQEGMFVCTYHNIALKPIWESRKDKLLEEWIMEFPGSRPRGWWLFSESSPFKYPNYQMLELHGSDMKVGYNAEWEPQAAFLKRHNLLTKREQKRLKMNDFEKN